MIGIYKVTNPKGKIYIGQSLDIFKRFKTYKGLHCPNQIKLRNSLAKYGVASHTFDVLEECAAEELNRKERYWQDYYNVLNNGLNCILTNTGSKSGRQSQDVIEKRASKLRKSVLQYTVKGIFVREWNSIKEVGEVLSINIGCIPTCCKGKIKSVGGFIWRYKTDSIQQVIQVPTIGKCRPIEQYSLDGVFIREWDSIKQAKQSMNNSRPDIAACLDGRQKQAGGFVWKYKKN